MSGRSTMVWSGAAALALLAACSSTERPGRSRSAEGTGAIVSIDELPPEYARILRDYAAGGALWEARRERVREDPRQTAFLVENLALEMVRAWERSRLETERGARGPYERARDELVLFGEAAAPLLTELFAVGDDVVAFVAADALMHVAGPACLPVAGLLEREETKVRRRAAELLASLPHARSAEEGVRRALASCTTSDPEWIVRATAARALGERGARDRETRPSRLALQRALADRDPAVVAVSAQALGVLGDAEAIPALANLLERGTGEGEIKIVRAAQAALMRLSGLPQLEVGRMRPRDWRAWWQARSTR